LDITKTTFLSVDLSGQYMHKTAPLRTADEIFNGMTLFPIHLIPMIYSDGSPSEHPESDNSGLRQNPYNYLYYSGYNTNWASTIQTKVTLEQKLDFITEGLSVRGNLSFDSYSEQFTNRSMSPNSFYAEGRDADGNLIKRERNSGSSLSNPSTGASSGNRKIYLEASLNYKRMFKDKHDVSAVLVYNQREEVKQNAGQALELLPYRKQNVVARATYGYDGRYMLEGSFGMTGSDNFAPDNRWGIFPAIGGAWYVSHEKFMESLTDVVNKLKLRVSYGKTGNDNVGNLGRFPYREYLSGPTGYDLGISSTYNFAFANYVAGRAENNAAAPLLRWEIEDKINAGFDLGLFGGRVDMSIDYFSNRRKDILIRRTTIPTMTGLRQGPLQNFGVVTNKGIDGNIVIKENFGPVSLTFRGNYTYTKNKVVQRDEIPRTYAYQNATGHSIDMPFLYISEGLYTPDDFDITVNPTTGAQSYKLKPTLPNPGAAVAPGDIKYADLNGDMKIDAYDQTYEHNFRTRNPDAVYGFGLNAEYKGFFAGVFFQGSSGTSVNLMSKAENFMPFRNGKDASSARTEALDRWTMSDPYNQNVLYPRMHAENFSYNLYNSTWWYRDASFLRLKNVEFGYQFNKKELKKLYMQNLRIYVQGTNLITWDKVKYWDPELGDARSGAKYPISQNWTVGLEVTF
jgi:TonB-linked outer membrane protein, SusC/RagA family